MSVPILKSIAFLKNIHILRSVELMTLIAVFGVAAAAAQNEAPASIPPPGTVLNSDNAAAYDQSLPAGAKFALQHGLQIKIAPAERLEWSGGFKHATEKYSPQVGLDADDMLVNYVAGMPFPLIDLSDPKVAAKIAYNWHMGPFMPDDFSLAPWSSNAFQIDPQNPKLVRPSDSSDYACERFDFLRFAHRTEVEPRPNLGANSTGVEWKAKCNNWTANGLGSSINEGAGIWIRFLDPHHADEFYGFSESSRRVRRSAVKLEFPNEGCRTCHQPYWAYALPKTEIYSYRLLGTRTILACLTATDEPAGLKQGSTAIEFTEQPFEPRHAYTIEMIPKDPHRAGTRAIVDIDSEIYVWLAAEFFEGSERTAVTIPLWRRHPSSEGGSLFDLAGTVYVPSGGREFFRSVVPAHGSFDQKINTGAISPGIFNPQAMSR
jgi:hypothetical protein